MRGKSDLQIEKCLVVVHGYNNEKKVLEDCEKVCQLTHFDPRCVDSFKIHGLTLSRVIKEEDLH